MPIPPGFTLVDTFGDVELYVRDARGVYHVRHTPTDRHWRFTGEPEELGEIHHLIARLVAMRGRVVKDDADRAEIAHLRYRLESSGLDI